MAQQKRSWTKEGWDEVIGTFKMFSNLDRPAFRKEIEELARELEREGLAAHRAADRLEGLVGGAKHGRPSEHAADQLEGLASGTKHGRPSDHARSAVLARLRRQFTPQHLHVPERALDRLAETGLHLPGQLRRQAATILDGADFIGASLRYYEEFIAEHRSSGRGPRPSLAMTNLETTMIHSGVRPTETVKHLAAAGIHLTVESLKMRLSRRRRRDRQRGE